jgi:hypothetical protein
MSIPRGHTMLVITWRRASCICKWMLCSIHLLIGLWIRCWDVACCHVILCFHEEMASRVLILTWNFVGRALPVSHLFGNHAGSVSSNRWVLVLYAVVDHCMHKMCRFSHAAAMQHTWQPPAIMSFHQQQADNILTWMFWFSLFFCPWCL